MTNSYKRAITIDHTKIVAKSRDLNFAMKPSRSGWSASSSSHYPGYEPSFTADMAIGVAGAYPFWASNFEMPCHIIIDMGSDVTFNHVIVDPSNDNGSRIITSWEVYVSDDGLTWGTAVATGGSFVTQTEHVLYLGASHTKRYFKFRIVTQAGDTAGCVNEIYVANMIPRGSWSATGSSTYSSYAASKALDGITSSNNFWASNNEMPCHLIVDMGSAQTFTHLIVDPINSEVTRVITGWEVYVSDDGATWGSAVKTGTSFGKSAVRVVDLGQSFTKRYVKFRILSQSGDNFGCINEIYVANATITDIPADLTDYVMLVSGTYSYLAHTTHGGKVQNVNGYDIYFTSDVDGTTKLKFERVSYNHETGAVKFWVKVPTVDSDADTVVYIWYGDSTISTDQQDPANTWASGVGVYHCEEAGQSDNLTDSIGVNQLVKDGADASSETGQVGNGRSLVSTTAFDKSIGRPNTTGPITIEAWATKTATGGLILAGIGANTTLTRVCLYYDDTSGICVEMCNYSRVSNYYLIDGLFHHLAATIPSNGATSGIKIYCDGCLLPGVDSGNGGNLSFPSSINMRVSGVPGYSGDEWKGVIDEVLFSAIEKSGAYFGAFYNNTTSPSSFYSIGTETEVSGGGDGLLLNPDLTGGLRSMAGGFNR